MYANGFFEQKRRSPAAMAAVIGLHGAAFTALILFGTMTYQREAEHRLTLVDVQDQQPPPPNPPPPPQPRDPRTPQQPRERLDTSTSPVSDGPTVAGPPVTPPPPGNPTAGDAPVRIAIGDIPRIPEPIRRAAEVDPRYRDALQPPYPRDRETAQQGGQVRVRVTIGTDGRVTAIERVSATDEAFWRVTERQARARWRFRPATVDGRPIVSTMAFTITFRIPDDG